MRVFRLYVGRRVGSDGAGALIRHDDVVKAAGSLFEGATVYESHGVWRGRSEPSSVIEAVDLDGEPETRAQVHAAAVTLAKQFGQDAVLVVEQGLFTRAPGFFGPAGEVQLEEVPK